jgi:hypothetical protein
VTDPDQITIFDLLDTQQDEPRPLDLAALEAELAGEARLVNNAAAAMWIPVIRDQILETAAGGACLEPDLDAARKAAARAALDSRRARPLHLQWRTIRANPRREQPPRQPISRRLREAVHADGFQRCWYEHRDRGEHELEVGHMLTLSEAWDLTALLGDTRPWQIANSPENLHPQCRPCNTGQGTRSQTALVAGKIMARPRGNTLPLRWPAMVAVVEWCRVLDELETGTEPRLPST